MHLQVHPCQCPHLWPPNQQHSGTTPRSSSLPQAPVLHCSVPRPACEREQGCGAYKGATSTHAASQQAIPAPAISRRQITASQGPLKAASSYFLDTLPSWLHGAACKPLAEQILAQGQHHEKPCWIRPKACRTQPASCFTQ